MRAKIEKDRKKRVTVKKFEKKRNELKSIIYNDSYPNEERLRALQKLRDLPRDGAACRVKNRGVLTGRSKSVYRDFKISRILLRKKGLEGFLPGTSKASW